MNKLRLIRIYELRGKIHPIEAAIIELFVTFYNSKDEVSFDVYKTLIKFGLSYKELDEIFKYLFEKHLKLKFYE